MRAAGLDSRQLKQQHSVGELMDHGQLVTEVASKVLLISVLASLVELLPLGDDNLTVPLASAVLAQILLGA